MQRTHYERFLMGTGTTLRQIINMTTDSQIIDHPKRWKYMVLCSENKRQTEHRDEVRWSYMTQSV